MNYIVDEDDYLAHYGILRKSGRYPWGSGGQWGTGESDTIPQRSKAFLDHVQVLRKKYGLSDTEIARGFGMTTTEFRDTNSIAKASFKQDQINQAQRLRDKMYSNVKIGEIMGLNESSVRALLAPGAAAKADILTATAQKLRDEVAEKGVVDVGTGVEKHMGISDQKLKAAISILKDEGYGNFSVQVDQAGTQNKTLIKVLTKPGMTYRDVVTDKSQIKSIAAFSEDGGKSYQDKFHPPLSIDSKRVGVRYKEEGGADAAGVISVRPGVDDITLGGSRYAQVRVAVDGTHYLKGMAMYKDDLPKGTDLLFNTNKSDTGNKLDAMKKMEIDKETGKVDMENPFGATIDRQIADYHPDGKLKRVTSVMNIVNEEGRWGEWARSLSSQFLSKQTPTLAKQQLDEAYDRSKAEFDKIMSLTNPAVRKKLLEGYAEGADASASHLKAAALPRQGTHVILPMNSMKDSEVYAPNYNNGDRVVLVRFPHGGIFEIPELKVNNNHPEAKSLLGNAADAIGINAKVAERLSGADFDGDTVLVIPNPNGAIKTHPALESLKGFDPKASYPAYEGMTKIKPRTKQIQMGVVSNLITDMTIAGAPMSELARAVRHSMVVIDAEKHNLDYKRSALDNGITQLKAKYQGSARGGAATIISQRKKTTDVPDRRARRASEGGPIDPATGRKMYVPTGKTKVQRKVNKKTGEVTETVVPKTIKVKKLDEATDAHTLSSGTKIESVYADHSNRMKALANTARRELIHTPNTEWDHQASKIYAPEVARLTAALNEAIRNRPLERQAQVLAEATIAMKRQANPDMDDAELKKVKSQALRAARYRTGAGKSLIQITDREWEAIQHGALSNSKLTDILDNADIDRVKELATPRTSLLMTSSNQSRARQMLDRGYTQAEVASALGVSVSTLKRSVGGS